METNLIKNLETTIDLLKSLPNFDFENYFKAMNKLLNNVLMMEKENENINSVVRSLRLNITVLSKIYPFIKAENVMTNPVGLFFVGSEKVCITANQYCLNYNTTLEDIQDKAELNGITSEQQELIMFDEVADEITNEYRNLVECGNIIYPYMPCVLIKAADVKTFQPKYCFKTRFGCLSMKVSKPLKNETIEKYTGLGVVDHLV